MNLAKVYHINVTYFARVTGLGGRREVNNVFCIDSIKASHIVSCKIHKGELGIQDQMIISLGGI